MAESPSVVQLNREVADRINEEALKDPSSPHAGKFVGIIDGQVVVVAEDLDEAMKRLRQTGADPNRMFCFEAGLDYSRVVEIWSPF
jgi:Family of unknown function (DUF5678)